MASPLRRTEACSCRRPRLSPMAGCICTRLTTSGAVVGSSRSWRDNSMSVQKIGAASAIRLRFGPFELNVAERSLKKASQLIPLGGRAYEILIALLQNAGEVVPKSELIARAWPDVTVEEGSL